MLFFLIPWRWLVDPVLIVAGVSYSPEATILVLIVVGIVKLARRFA